MDWARDQLGHLVEASGKGLFSYGLKCPTCAERVYRRAGDQRRPHFAHYSFGAKPGCELYRPVFVANIHRSHAPGERSVIRSPGFRGGLFLGQRAGGGFQLYLRLPRLESATGVTGEVKIQSALGIRNLVAGNLLSKQFIPLSPAVPLVEVSGSGMLSEVAETVRQDVMQFCEASNFFRSVEDGGRLVLLQEPLELGQRYCVLGRQALSIPPFDVGVRITDQSEVRGWYFCEIELPRGLSDSARELADAVGRRLGRIVRPAFVHVWPIYPPPHHTEADGTRVYPIATKKIVVRRSGRCEVHIVDNGQADHSARVNWLDDEWGEIDTVGVVELCLFYGDQEQFYFKLEACELFAPVGIQVHTSDFVSDMFGARANDAALNEVPMKLRLVCPSERIAARVRIDEEAWERSGATITFVGTEGFRRVDAGGFGVLPERPRSKPLDAPSVTDPKRIWIEGIIMRLGGPTMVNMLPWRNPPDGSGLFQRLNLEDFSWLGAYVRAANGG